MQPNAIVRWALNLGLVVVFAAPVLAAQPEIVGRWDLTIGNGPTPSWIGIDLKDGKLHGRFLDTAGGVHPIGEVKYDAPRVEFTDKGNRTWTGTLEGDTITGERVDKNGQGRTKWTGKRFVPQINVSGAWRFDGKDNVVLRLRHADAQIGGSLREGDERPERIQDAKLDGYTLTFSVPGEQYTATVKGDVLDGVMAEEGGKKYEFKATRQREWGEPIELFNGKNLDGWKPLGDPNNFKWSVENGLMRCAGGSANIVSERKFGNFKLHVEFKVPEGGNSGVYLRGRHEVQVADSHGRNPEPGSCGSMYSRIVAKETACKPHTEWQVFDITFINHAVTVVHNGKTIIDNELVEGITGGAIDSRESEPGPIYLQGDHSAVDYRKVTITPAKPPAAGRRGQRGAGS
ncbi:MAG: hypothetical protein AMXMBFR13_46430 [Phycisphaerae bacterium]